MCTGLAADLPSVFDAGNVSVSLCSGQIVRRIFAKSNRPIDKGVRWPEDRYWSESRNNLSFLYHLVVFFQAVMYPGDRTPEIRPRHNFSIIRNGHRLRPIGEIEFGPFRDFESGGSGTACGQGQAHTDNNYSFHCVFLFIFGFAGRLPVFSILIKSFSRRR